MALNFIINDTKSLYTITPGCASFDHKNHKNEGSPSLIVQHKYAKIRKFSDETQVLQ